jgi:mono/diheme cytochrome c family protein
MMRNLLRLALIPALALPAVSGSARTTVSLKSVSVDLPAGDRLFPQGPGSDAVSNNCLACHSAGMVLNQPALTKAEWEAEVNKMRNAYKAPVDPKDMGAIVGYLVSIKGRL